MTNLPTTFESLYLKGSEILGDESPYISNYKDLDDLRAYIDGKDDKAQYLYALSDGRTCVVVPYKDFPDKRRSPDTQTKDGTLVIYACPGWDHYLSDLIDHMKNDLENNPQGTEHRLTQWKLLRLAKMYKLGWEQFATQYLAPLADKDKFLMSVLMSKYGPK